jgi:dihydroorotase
MDAETVSIRNPDDFHVHFRSGSMLTNVVPETVRHFKRALVMPNVPAIEGADAAFAYHAEICRAACDPTFVPMMTIKLTHRTTRETIQVALGNCVVAAKLYPEGATTASHDGIQDPRRLAPVFAAMQELGMVLCIHGEDPAEFVLDREQAYLAQVAWIVRNFPGLKVVLEHITTDAAVDFVRDASVNVAATITAHHLDMTLNDLIGDGIRPHLYCKPVPKTNADRCSLINAAFYENGGRFFFGSDSAPHRREDKESPCGCAGVYSAPVAMAVLAKLFLRDDLTTDAVSRLQAFTSERGADFYDLPRNEGTITLARCPWVVPEIIDGVVPFRAGETLEWQVVDRRLEP